MTSILVTGGTGAFGRAFIKRLMQSDDYDRICVYSRSEHAQAGMRAEIADPHDRLRFFIGDVRDRWRLTRAMEPCKHVVHAAALKRIEVGFYNPVEMVKTNVLGAVNVIEAAQDAWVEKVVALSTDKAYQPVSPYGTSKAMAESLFLSSNNAVPVGGPRFSVCRYGNVWNSTGSVFPTWKKLIASGCDTVPVTDPDCTRFFMTLDSAVDLVRLTLNKMKGGETVIPDLPAYKLGDLAEAMGVEIEVQGLPHWEKKHESMSDQHHSKHARRMSVQELKDAIIAANATVQGC